MFIVSVPGSQGIMQIKEGYKHAPQFVWHCAPAWTICKNPIMPKKIAY